MRSPFFKCLAEPDREYPRMSRVTPYQTIGTLYTIAYFMSFPNDRAISPLQDIGFFGLSSS
jgi:hypothetical protein